MRTENKNKILFYFTYAIRMTAGLCATGTLFQTFLASLGFSAEEIYIHASLMQAINVATILLGAGFADTKSVIKRAGLVRLPAALFFLSCIPFCMIADASMEAYLYLLAISAVYAVFGGLHTVCEYKLPYLIFRPESYGVILSISGILGALLSLGSGALVSFLSLNFAYTQIMTVAFLIAGILLIIETLLFFSMKALPELENEAKEEKRGATHALRLAVFRHPAFWQLLPANVLRGFASGTTTVLAVIALNLGYSESVSAALVSVQSAVTLLGCVVFGLLSKRIHPRYSIAIGSLAFLFLPLLLVPNASVFLVGVGFVLFGRTIVDSAVPAGLRYAVPAEIAGPYNAWRMVIHSGSSLVATTVAIFLPTSVLLLFTLLAQLLAGGLFLFLRVMRETGNAVEIQKS